MRFFLLIFLLAPLLVGGCVAARPDQFATQVRQWIPIGTPTEDARRIMERHGFECHYVGADHALNSTGVDYLECDREQVRFHDWTVRFILRDQKVSDYGFIKVN